MEKLTHLLQQHENWVNGLVISTIIVGCVCYFSQETDPQKHFQKGLSIYKTAHNHEAFGDAVTYFDKTIALKPTYAEAYYHRGLAKHSFYAMSLLVNKDEILADYNKSIALNPNLAEVYYWRALIRNALQSYDTHNCENLIAYEESVKDLQKAIALKPNYTDAIHLLGHWQCCRTDYHKALENLNLALKLGGFYNGDYDKIEALKDLAKAYSKLKKYQQALKTYNTLIDLAKEKYHDHLDTNLVKLYEGRMQTNKHLGYFDAIYLDELQIEKIKEKERYQDYNMPPSPAPGI